MEQENITQLQAAVEHMHDCTAKWIKSECVKEKFKGQTVWEGIVQIFDINGNSTASRCYAWSHGFDGLKKRKFFAVLHKKPVDSPQKAVRAAIVSEFKK